MNFRHYIGIAIIIAFVIWGSMAFLNTTVQYVPISVAMKSTQTVQVMGKVDFDVVNYNTEVERLEFAVYDAEAESKATAVHMPVYYYGVVPGNFDQATSVVLKGKVDDSAFVAEQMLVKCPSKYQGEGGEYQTGEEHDEATGD